MGLFHCVGRFHSRILQGRGVACIGCTSGCELDSLHNWPHSMRSKRTTIIIRGGRIHWLIHMVLPVVLDELLRHLLRIQGGFRRYCAKEGEERLQSLVGRQLLFRDGCTCIVGALIVRTAWNVIPAMNANGTGLWDMTGGSDPWYMKRVVDYVIAERSHLIFDHDRAYPTGGINPRPPLFSWSLALGRLGNILDS